MLKNALPRSGIIGSNSTCWERWAKGSSQRRHQSALPPAMYGKVFISLHCHSHSLLSQFWNFVDYTSEKYHYVACSAFFSRVRWKLFPVFEAFAFLYLWNIQVIFFLTVLLGCRYLFFSSTVFRTMFLHFGHYAFLLCSPTWMEANGCSQHRISFPTYLSPASQTASCK